MHVLTTSDQHTLRQHAALRLGQLGAAAAVAPLCVAARADPHPLVRAAAAQALGDLGDPQAVDPLLLCLRDRRGAVRAAAAASLQRFPAARIVEPLIACLRDRDGAVRLAAARSLGAAGDERVVTPLLACLQEQDDRLRRAALESLGAFRTEALVEPLLACLRDRDKQVRRLAAGHLGRLGSRRAVEPLIACLQDPNAWVRQLAVRSLGDLDDERAIEPFLVCLRDPDQPMRDFAAFYLGKACHNHVACLIDPLLACVRSALPEERAAAASVLGELSDERVIELLLACIDDQDMRVYWAASADKAAILEMLVRLSCERLNYPDLATWRKQTDHEVHHFAQLAYTLLNEARAIASLSGTARQAGLRINQLFLPGKRIGWLTSSIQPARIRSDYAVQTISPRVAADYGDNPARAAAGQRLWVEPGAYFHKYPNADSARLHWRIARTWVIIPIDPFSNPQAIAHADSLGASQPIAHTWLLAHSWRVRFPWRVWVSRRQHNRRASRYLADRRSGEPGNHSEWRCHQWCESDRFVRRVCQ